MTGISLWQASAGSLLAIVVLLILTGRLVPYRMLRDARAEADRWRSAYELEREARERLAIHAAAGIEAARTATAVLTALPVAPAGGNPDASAVA
ncbi:hypothetical protein KGA66_05985 [Actinocrinis puniceicyclus]|uniref:Uncharacterized protein n=1 Tax=Actinocrinis puniceicyclus TaxID=977794 RepID=A0A8J8BAZ8_9ACTN|nr:hypothetical protein [Actinocrinis puniceicyclus]MBS2962588.1 hypothetical protein [Actinocrinis puniceicyclus]